MSLDLLIVGAGPCGVSAALWSRTLGLPAMILESGAIAGGQLELVHFPLADLAGVTGLDGPALAGTLGAQLTASGVACRFDTAALTLEPGGDDTLPAVRDASGGRFEARAVLVATGVRRRRLDVPGEREFEGRGVSSSATRDRARFAGLPMAVAGGGDAAFANALLLAEVGCPVTLAVRGRPRARLEFRERVKADPRIAVREETHVAAILGTDHVEAVRLEGSRGAEDLPVAGIVIKVGMIPNTEWCRDVLDHDAEGFLSVDERGATSARGVWAAGDVARPALPSVAVAIGGAALAVADIRRELRGPTGS